MNRPYMTSRWLHVGSRATLADMNPYESPATVGRLRSTPVLWRMLAVILWLLGIWPVAVVGLAFVTRGLPLGFDPRDPGVWAGVASALLPFVAFGLLGLAAWLRSRRLAIAGLVVVGVHVAVICGALLVGLLP